MSLERFVKNGFLLIGLGLPRDNLNVNKKTALQLQKRKSMVLSAFFPFKKLIWHEKTNNVYPSNFSQNLTSRQLPYLPVYNLHFFRETNLQVCYAYYTRFALFGHILVTNINQFIHLFIHWSHQFIHSYRKQEDKSFAVNGFYSL